MACRDEAVRRAEIPLCGMKAAAKPGERESFSYEPCRRVAATLWRMPAVFLRDARIESDNNLA